VSVKLYVVHGADRTTGLDTEKVFEATNAADATEQAQQMGLLVRGVEIYIEQIKKPQSVIEHGAKRTSDPDEKTIWTGVPSQWSNFGTFVFAGIFWWLFFIPVLVAIYSYLITRSMQMTITTERLRLEWGILSKNLEEIELYRVRDTSVNQSFVERILKLGTVIVHTADQTAPIVRLRAIPDPRGVREMVRKYTEVMRQRRNVRDIDVS
jgi:membrane protein YdbS with pleckstrin-like domain